MNSQYKKELLEVFIRAARDSKMLDAFLADILTPGEYKELTNRWQIVKRLTQGEGQRKISRDLKVGLTTVTRGVHELEDPDGGFNQILQKL